MSVVIERALMTPDELLVLPNEGDYELVDGELRERKPMSALSSWVGGKISRLLGTYVDEQGLGWIFPSDAGFQCFGEMANTMRRPDVAYVRADRLPVEQIGEGYVRIVPDLVVEVNSPHDLAEDVEDKLRLFLAVGVPLLWIISPTSRTVRVIRSDGSSAYLREVDQLSGEGVIPGFACSVSAIFPPGAKVEPKA